MDALWKEVDSMVRLVMGFLFTNGRRPGFGCPQGAIFFSLDDARPVMESTLMYQAVEVFVDRPSGLQDSVVSFRQSTRILQ
jgi:hypothetical protein